MTRSTLHTRPRNILLIFMVKLAPCAVDAPTDICGARTRHCLPARASMLRYQSNPLPLMCQHLGRKNLHLGRNVDQRTNQSGACHASDRTARPRGEIRRLAGNHQTDRTHTGTVDKLRRALESAGIEFSNGDRPGVRLTSTAAKQIDRTE